MSSFSDVCTALYTERPMGNSIWLEPRLELTPPKAACGHGAPPQREFPESSPFAAKSEILAAGAAAKKQLIAPCQLAPAGELAPAAAAGAHPAEVTVVLIAARAAAVLR